MKQSSLKDIKSIFLTNVFGLKKSTSKLHKYTVVRIENGESKLCVYKWSETQTRSVDIARNNQIKCMFITIFNEAWSFKKMLKDNLFYGTESMG